MSTKKDNDLNKLKMSIYKIMEVINNPDLYPEIDERLKFYLYGGSALKLFDNKIETTDIDAYVYTDIPKFNDNKLTPEMDRFSDNIMNEFVYKINNNDEIKNIFKNASYEEATYQGDIAYHHMTYYPDDSVKKEHNLLDNKMLIYRNYDIPKNYLQIFISVNYNKEHIHILELTITNNKDDIISYTISVNKYLLRESFGENIYLLKIDKLHSNTLLALENYKKIIQPTDRTIKMIKKYTERLELIAAIIKRGRPDKSGGKRRKKSRKTRRKTRSKK